MQVQTDVPAIAPGKYLICLEQSSSSPINHLAIFLTGASLFGPGLGASVFASFDLGTSWRYLGVLANEKPSAFFRLNTGAKANATASASTSTSTSALSSTSSLAAMQDAPAASTPIQIGISIEPIAVLEQLMMEHSSQALVPLPPPPTASAATPLAVAQRIGEHLFNYMASFGRAARELDPACPAVPLRAVQDWFGALLRRASTDPEGFLRKFAD